MEATFDIDSCRKWEKLTANATGYKCLERHSYTQAQSMPISIPIPITIPIYGIWHVMKMKRGARVFQVPQEEMHSQWEAQESSESCPVAVAMLHMLTTQPEH